MPGDPPIIYWDACIFIAWLNEEKRSEYPEGELEHWAEQFMQGKAKLITSAITLLEMLEHRMKHGARDKFLRFMRPPRAQMFDVSPPVLDMAYQLRNHYSGLLPPAGRPQHPTLSVPDAIHVATGMLRGATHFHTIDAGRRKRWGPLNITDLSMFGSRMEISLPKSERNLGLWEQTT